MSFIATVNTKKENSVIISLPHADDCREDLKKGVNNVCSNQSGMANTFKTNPHLLQMFRRILQ